MKRIYRLKFYINASHAIRWEKGIGQKHNHTWEIVCEFKGLNDKFISFFEAEKVVRNILDKFEGTYLNETPTFKNINPTLENVTEVFFERLSQDIKKVDGQLVQVEIAEKPTHIFRIEAEDDL
ncbi:6-carboxytetrahydropterin synthase [Lactococcus garvieae]|mgnify:FL=1|jgi:6-pyruvoyltetrahydropterin/6-carboxytetrahydropterin synthase|uniref:6-carboxytetrahydropterin synthase n=1 Tax=Lactococcus garvieae TaxID=1363 RepID=UPI0018D83C77|nr:6-carboxytetrahydropterin synthase [Lactococcus garvieae]QPS71002.1 6-carboxytetrahydropterin synthase [Lactococcus garvieae]